MSGIYILSIFSFDILWGGEMYVVRLEGPDYLSLKKRKSTHFSDINEVGHMKDILSCYYNFCGLIEPIF